MPDPPRVLPGTPLGQLPSFSASWINDVSAMVRWYKRTVDSGQGAGQSSALESTSGLVKVKNLSGHDLLRGHYVQLGDYLLDAVNHRQHWYKGNLYDSAEKGRIAIVEKAVKTASPTNVQARTLGRCTARVNVTDITHRFAEPDNGAYVLKSATTGNIEITSNNLVTTTGEQEVAVIVNGGGATTSDVRHYRVIVEIPAATGHLAEHWGRADDALSLLAIDGSEVDPTHDIANMIDGVNEWDFVIPKDAKLVTIGGVYIPTCNPFIDWDDLPDP